MTDSAQRLWLEAAELTVTGPELSLIEDICPLIGATPRAVKRFINVYLLLKSVGRSRGWPLPEQGHVAVLLAIATGLPDLADELLPSLATAEPCTLGAALPERADAQAGAQLLRLRAWLADHRPGTTSRCPTPNAGSSSSCASASTACRAVSCSRAVSSMLTCANPHTAERGE